METLLEPVCTCHSEALVCSSVSAKGPGTVRGDSPGDYLSCLIHSAGQQHGHIMRQKLTLSDYDVIRSDSPCKQHLGLSAHINLLFLWAPLSMLISVNCEIWSFCDDKFWADIKFHQGLMYKALSLPQIKNCHSAIDWLQIINNSNTWLD